MGSPVQLTWQPGAPGFFQVVQLELTNPDRIIQPADLRCVKLPRELDPSQGVIITGRAPIWLYGFLVHECHHCKWVACYDPRFPGGVVVSSHAPEARVGQVIPWRQGPLPVPGPAVAIVGPPNSGKSHLAQALFEQLLTQEPNIYLQRGNWDGEGNWLLDLEAQNLDGTLIHALKQGCKGQPTPTFFDYQAQVVRELRRQKKLVLVDLGGKIDPAKAPLLQACTHYLLVSHNPALLRDWHDCCQGYGLQLLATIHSSRKPVIEILQTSPDLTLRLGGWDPLPPLPQILVERLAGLLAGCT